MFITIPTFLTLVRAVIAPPILSALILWLIPLQNPSTPYLLAFLFALGACTDFLDGYLARSLNQQSVLGALLDPIADKLYVCSLFIALAGIGLLHPLWAIFFVGRELYMTSVRYIAATYRCTIPVSSRGKQKTAVHMILITLLLITAYSRSTYSIISLSIDFLLIVAIWLSFISAYHYTRLLWRELGVLNAHSQFS